LISSRFAALRFAVLALARIWEHHMGGKNMMLSLAHPYEELVAAGGRSYRARVYGAVDADARWGGWIIFFPVAGGRAIATGRETTQSSLANLTHWASALSPTYLEGALARALGLTPEAQMARELERLEQLEASAEVRAETLERAATAARTQATLAEAARERAEEGYLATVADAAERDAVAHEVAADISRDTAEAADRALRSRTKSADSKRSTAGAKRSASKRKK
jgi:hypothetical protein